MSIDNPRLTVGAANQSALDRIPEQFYWIIGKGRLRTDEPLYGIQIKEPATGEVVAEAEHDDLAAAIDLACNEIAATPPAQPAPASGESCANSILRAIWDDIETAAVETPVDNYECADIRPETLARLADHLAARDWKDKADVDLPPDDCRTAILPLSVRGSESADLLQPVAPGPSEAPSTHGKPDGSARCDCGFSSEVCASNPCYRKQIHRAGLTPGSKWPNTGSPAALHSPKIAAAETSPGDVLAMKESCKRAVTATLLTGEARLACAAIDRLDVAEAGLPPIDETLHPTEVVAALQQRALAPAEAKSQEPEVVAINGRPYGTDVIDRLSERKLNCRQLSRYIWDRAHNDPDCFEQDIARLIQNERREAVKRAMARPATKPEAPAKVWRDIQSAIEQAIDCVRGETPEDCSDEDARADTLSKLRDADTAIAALIAGGR